MRIRIPLSIDFDVCLVFLFVDPIVVRLDSGAVKSYFCGPAEARMEEPGGALWSDAQRTLWERRRTNVPFRGWSSDDPFAKARHTPSITRELERGTLRTISKLVNVWTCEDYRAGWYRTQVHLTTVGSQ